jgi:hypothetical protein
MKELVIWNTYAQPLLIKRLGIEDLCLAESNNGDVSICKILKMAFAF